MLAAYIFFSIPSGAISYAYLVREHFRKMLWFTGISLGVQAGIVLTLMISGQSIGALLMALAGFAFCRWVFVLFAGRWFSYGFPSRTAMWTFFVFAIPLILHAFNSGLMDYVDGWIVSLFFGEDSFAWYRYGARELPFNALLIGGLTTGLVHRFKTQNVVDADTLRNEISRVMRMLFPVNCLLILLSVPLYSLVYSDDFVFAARIFNVYALTLLSRVIMNQVFCYVHHLTWVLTWSTLAEVVLNIILSLLLMQWMGLIGIPLATVLSYAAQKLFLVFYVGHKFHMPLSRYVPVTQCIWYFTAMILCVVLAELIYF